MKTLAHRARRYLRIAREMTFPQFDQDDTARAQARRAAEALWVSDFAPLGTTAHGADVLEIGCGEGWLLAQLIQADHPHGGARSAVGLEPNPGSGAAGVEIHTDMRRLWAFDLAAFDLVVVRSVERIWTLDEVEPGLQRVFDLLRPGGEAVLCVECADLQAPDFTGPGYGFLTPSSWAMLMMRAGFEIAESRRFLGDAIDARTAAALLPQASEGERMTRRITFRLLRPWASWELERLHEVGD